MTTVNFPSNPTTNDLYVFGNTTWKFNGEGWNLNIANTAPVAIFEGGTGATTASQAITNLGAASNTYVQSAFTSNTYVQDNFAGNTYVQNNFAGNTYVQNNFAGNTYVQNNFSANAYVQSRDSYIQNTFMIVAVSDETTAITTGTGKVRFRAPFAMTLWQIPRASVNTASTSGVVTVDINEEGTSILGANKLSIDANEKTSVTAATATTLADTSIADDAEITIDIDGAGTGANGLKVTLYYSRT